MSDLHPNAVVVERSRRPSIVWLVPIVAALIGLGLAYHTWSERGPEITLTFKSADGLSAGKTRIKYRDVDVGVVRGVELAEDMNGVVVRAELVKYAAPLLKEETKFWVVRPQVGLSGISGLGTLFSGAYIGVLPGTGSEQRSFGGLEKPPARAAHEGALGITLTGERLGAVTAGAPVTYRSIKVGEVESYELSADGQSVRIQALVDAEYQHLVRTNTQFWNDSGVGISLGADGLEISAESLSTMLAGGIAFDTPDAEAARAVGEAASFTLFENRDAAIAAYEKTHGLNLYVEAPTAGSVGAGAPVYYRGQRVGHVGKRELSPDAKTIRLPVHVDPRYATLVRKGSKFWNMSGVSIDAGLDGVSVRTSTLASILTGGIAFATPTGLGAEAESGELFALHDAPRATWLAWTPAVWVDDDAPAAPVRHVVASRPRKPKGLDLVLEAAEVGSLKPGDHIYYREVRVGRIGSHELSPDARTVLVRAVIEDRYRDLVRSNSVFWNASGIHAKLGLGGLDIQTESLEALMAGGVAFATPNRPGAAVRTGAVFRLHPEVEDDWLRWTPAIPIGATPGGIAARHAIDNGNEAVSATRAVSSGPGAGANGSGPSLLDRVLPWRRN